METYSWSVNLDADQRGSAPWLKLVMISLDNYYLELSSLRRVKECVVTQIGVVN